MKRSEFRLVRKTEQSEDAIDYHFLVCKVYYDYQGNVTFINTAECVRGRSPKSAEDLHKEMAEAFLKPILDYDTAMNIQEPFV